ncbi:MAG: WD40 repeat domain-containing protein, partial [Microcystis sp.]
LNSGLFWLGYGEYLIYRAIFSFIVPSPTLEHSDHINSVSVSPNNQLLASGSDDKRLKLWDLKAGKAIISIPHPQKIYSVCFSPDGNYIATACQDKIVRVYGTSELQSLAS